MADESSKSDDPASSAGVDIPEVEAEVVEENEPPAHESAFTDRESKTDPADIHADANPAPKRMPFTPGVILFFAFAAFALVVFAMWRLQGSGKTPAAATPQQQESLPFASIPEEESDAPVANKIDDPAPAQEFAGSAVDDAADDTDGAASDADASTGVDSGKIDNSQFAELKNTMNDLDPVADIAPGGDVYLPPLGSDEAAPEGNQALQQNAKDAYRAFKPSSGAPDIDGDETPSAPDNTLAFDIEGGGADVVMRGQTDLDKSDAPIGDGETALNSDSQARAAPATQLTPSLDTSDQDTKLQNDIAAIKQSFEAEKAQLTKALDDERQRNARQREEIETLRRDFQSTLNARDQQANEALLELRTRLNKIRNDEVTPIALRVASAAALKSLERAFDEGAPFLTELDNFEDASEGAPATVILRKYADFGLVSMQTLKERFGAVASDALAAARKEQAKGVGGALIAQAQNIITIRPAKPQSGDGPGAIISRAEYAVENNDIAVAIAELANLPPAGRDAMAPWITDAQARIEAVSAMSDLNDLIFGALSQ